MSARKRGRLPSTKIKFNRCRGCLQDYKGRELDKDGKVLRIFNCRTHCKSMGRKRGVWVDTDEGSYMTMRSLDE